MINIKKSLLSVMILSLSACTATTTPPQQQAAETKPSPTYLFVIHANGGKLYNGKDGMHLVLKNPTIIYFTDRPYRAAGHMKKANFLKLWQEKLQDNFAKDHPNAALAGLNYYVNNGKQDSDQAIEINKVLMLDAVSWNKETNLMDFKTKSIYQQHPLELGKIDDIALFIDAMDNSADSLF